MTWAYEYDPHVWPAAIALALTGFLAIYGWYRRDVPGAIYFSLGCFFASLWALGSIMEISAVDFSTKVFWVKFQVMWQLPAATAMPVFVLVYAGLGRFVTRRNLILLSIPVFATFVLIATNDSNHLIWSGFTNGEYVIRIPGTLNPVLVGYANILGLGGVSVLIWLAVRSPYKRQPAIIMLCGQIAGRTAFVINTYGNILEPGEAILVMFGLWFSTYAVPLFRFHVLDPIPLARSAVIEQMGDGMIVLDLQGNIIDLNSTTGRIFGRPLKKLKGSFIGKLLPQYPEIASKLTNNDIVKTEIRLESDRTNYFSCELSVLRDQRGQALGYLLLLSDITEQKQAQEQLIAQQGVVATLRERERLARELHDGIGQVLGYVGMQAQSARKFIQLGNIEKADSVLDRLAETAIDAHADVRESILELKTVPAQEWSFIPALKQYVDRFQTNYGVRVEVLLPDNIDETIFDPAEGVQLLRIIQEAMTNSRKHSGASNIKIAIERADGHKVITISDNGGGFDVERSDQAVEGHFGLGFMRERMGEIGGSLKIDSQLGGGTRIRLSTPSASI